MDGFTDGHVLQVHGQIYVVGALAVYLQHRVSWWLGVCVFATCVLPGPYGLPENQKVQRALTCFTSGFYFSRMLQLASAPRNSSEYGKKDDNMKSKLTYQRPLWLKLSHTFLTFMDTRGTYGGPPASQRETLKAYCQIGLAVLNTLIVCILGHVAQFQFNSGATDVELACAILLGGLAIMVGLTAFGDMLCGFWFIVAGLRLPTLMRNPLMSLSLREFWGKRWNSVIQNTLKQYVFLNVSRCGAHSDQRIWKRIAAGATFMCSGLIHAYPVFIANNCILGRPVFMVLSYFLWQGFATYLQQAFTTGCLQSSGDSRLVDRLVVRALTLCSVILPAPILVAVMMILPLEQGSGHLINLETRLVSYDFAATWVWLTLAVSILLAILAELFMYTGFCADFFHFKDQRERILGQARV